MSHATIQHVVVLKSKFHVNADAAVMLTNSTKLQNADMFLSTTLKLPAVKFQSTMMLMSAKQLKNTLTTSIANMFQDTTGNILHLAKHATHAQLVADN